MPWILTTLFVGLSTVHAEEGDITISEVEPEPAVPDVYTIQPGDTLWEISTSMLKNPNDWPQLWSFNEYITNPHWIYPGNRLMFTMGDLLNPPRMDLEGEQRDGYNVSALNYESTDAVCGPDIRFDKPYPLTRFIVDGFLSKPKDLKAVGKVSKSPHNQSFMVERNLVYLKVKDPNSYTCGDVVTIYRKTKKKVKHPFQRRNYGSMYRVVGEAKVVHRYGNYITASIRNSWDGVARGDLVGNPRPTILQLNVQTPEGDLSGIVVQRLKIENSTATERDIIFIDRGSNDGVKEGDSFYVVQQRDEYLQAYAKDDRKLPPRVIGRIVVVSTESDHSTAVITDASKGINEGAMVTQEVD